MFFSCYITLVLVFLLLVCLEFSPEFFHISAGPSDTISLTVPRVRPRKLMSFFPHL